MKLSKSQGIHIALLSVGFILGIGIASAVYWLPLVPEDKDHSSDATTTSDPTNTNELVAIQSTANGVAPSSSNLPNTPIRNLDDLDKFKSSFEKGLALRILLDDLTEVQVADLLKHSQEIPSSFSVYDFQRAVVQKLAQIDPHRALSRVLVMDALGYRRQFAESIFRDWAHSDLDAAVAHARTLNNEWKTSALHTIVRARTDLSDGTLRAIGRKLGNEPFTIATVARRKIEQSIGNPEESWHELVTNMQIESQNMNYIGDVALAWAEKNGVNVLDQVLLSLSNSQDRHHVLRRVLSNVVLSDPVGTFRYALTIKDDPNHSTIQRVSIIWASSDPQSALTAASEVQNWSLRKELESVVADVWANHKPKEVVANIDVFPAHVQSTAISEALRRIARDSPKEAARLVSSIDSGDARARAALSVAFTWIRKDQEAALDWILNEPAMEELKRHVLQHILPDLAPGYPEIAMEIALAQPVKEGDHVSRTGLELSVIATLANLNLQKALELLPQVRQGTRTAALIEVSDALIQNGDVDEVFRLIQQAPTSIRASSYAAVALRWAKLDPDALLNSMNRFPTRELRSQIATILLSKNQLEEYFTHKQVDAAKKFLTDEDANSLEEG
ncbi:MAG: hypothetical protein OXG24_02435 [Gammaproteobacteria bacterium]|nr:hypothetical protein [Gammaproteobacteria bacterium]